VVKTACPAPSSNDGGRHHDKLVRFLVPLVAALMAVRWAGNHQTGAAPQAGGHHHRPRPGAPKRTIQLRGTGISTSRAG
jgi:hypothetical protein